MELYCRNIEIFDESLLNEFFNEFKSNGEDVVPGDCSLLLNKTYFSYKNFYYWYKAINNLSLGKKLRKGQVACSSFLVFEKETDNLVGIFDIRHNLKYPNGEILGHIGASIRPKYRGRGLYKDLLELCLIECSYYSIEEVVIAVEYDNLKSLKGVKHLFDDEELIPCNGTYFYVFKKEI